MPERSLSSRLGVLITKQRGVVWRYGFAVTATAIAVALTRVFAEQLQPSLFLLFWPAAMATALFCGVGPAFLSSITGVVAVNYFIIAPVPAFSWANILQQPVLAVFLFTTGLIGWMTSELRAARLRSEAESERIVRANEDLERGREFLEQAQTSAHLGSWDWDIGNNHVTWSDEMFRLYGYEPGSIVVTYETFLRSVHPDDREMVVRSIQDTLRTHIPFAFDHRIVRPDGTTRWLHGRGRVVVDAAGQPACMVGSGQDITEIRRVAETERRLADAARNAEARAQQANRAKTQFLAAMSHELRTPLNVIIGCSELLEIGIHGPLSSEQREILGRMQRSQRHLQALIEDLLGFAKLEVGRLEFRLVDVRLHALFVTLDETLRPQLDKKRLLYGYHGCNPDLTVRADPSRLEQIAINLLMNAVKFTRDGGEISVAVKVAGDAVAISVTDTGVGIPADKLELIFEPFVQLADGMSDRASGAGLGLAICRELARAMGGEITVTSTPGIGSTFTLRLPRGPDVVPDTTTASSPHEAALEPPA